MSDRLLKIAEVAERLNCSQSLVYSLIAQGRLRFVRLGKGQGGLRVRPEALDEFISTSENGGPSVATPFKFTHSRR